MNTLGKRLVKIRKEKGLTQKRLAELLDITPTRLNYWEKDKREPDISMIKKISEVLQIDPNFLIGLNFWTEDMFEDYRNAKNPADKLYLLTKYGVPDSLQGDYQKFLSCLRSSDGNDFLATEDEENLVLKTRALNDLGREQLIDYIELLLASPKFKE